MYVVWDHKYTLKKKKNDQNYPNHPTVNFAIPKPLILQTGWPKLSQTIQPCNSAARNREFRSQMLLFHYFHTLHPTCTSQTTVTLFSLSFIVFVRVLKTFIGSSTEQPTTSTESGGRCPSYLQTFNFPDTLKKVESLGIHFWDPRSDPVSILTSIFNIVVLNCMTKRNH